MVKQERALRTRQALVRAAAEVFAQDGFAMASLGSISRKAGVSSGALHFHFENKRVLARAVEDEAAAAVRVIAGPAPAGGPGPLQRLIDATHALAARLDRDVVVRAGFELGCGLPRRSGAVDLRRQWQAWVEEVLREAEREGALAEGVSAADASVAVVAATVGFEVLGAGDRAWAAPAVLVRFWGLLLPRLAAAGTLGRLLPGGSPGAAPGPS
ncbi:MULTISPECIES: ScbR family autoregulator-binding transcription factor [Streptomyces]|uniref:Pseudo gamma-butyrolactone receptor protein n=2 Tax=Streptomyces tsukubensis TaxID=83656 RepID=W0U0C9_9ACTN|nr:MULTISPECIES: ScbR family autoregulator-binding transcription factor [Streptomyces]AZK92494.1 TetR family transcriptional regulator [Streptomyces tsukubensis]EIF94516.1 regulatory protein [Streptomyces tsukubensis NRRL18488]MYS65017.1 TetR family transcriptional regulator [Streptomyces sp. SID5473]QKM65870.1 TetR family transcriptional regulator [Streptomyces tsukubensis NRRL18488]TAI40902.1 TetR family transcriptional regulator [Streptomyces tsukubensis]